MRTARSLSALSQRRNLRLCWPSPPPTSPVGAARDFGRGTQSAAGLPLFWALDTAARAALWCTLNVGRIQLSALGVVRTVARERNSHCGR